MWLHIIKHLRRSNKFECHTIDNSKKYINIYKKNYKTNNLFFHYCVCNVSTYNGKICTFFDNIPNICPDFIYIDGPDQFSPRGDVRGLNTNHPDRVPMSADLLAIEHFLLPGTLIVLDGRTANARFLKSNFQRQWNHWHSQEFDQHFFELSEEPLGILNKNQIDFCLGTEFYDRLRKFKKIE